MYLLPPGAINNQTNFVFSTVLDLGGLVLYIATSREKKKKKKKKSEIQCIF